MSFLDFPYVTSVIMPMLVLVLHFKNTGSKVIYLFYAILASMGLTAFFGPVLLSVIFAGPSSEIMVVVFAIVALLVYFSASFFASKVLIKRFMILPEPDSNPQSQPEEHEKKEGASCV